MVSLIRVGTLFHSCREMLAAEDQVTQVQPDSHIACWQVRCQSQSLGQLSGFCHLYEVCIATAIQKTFHGLYISFYGRCRTWQQGHLIGFYRSEDLLHLLSNAV